MGIGTSTNTRRQDEETGLGEKNVAHVDATQGGPEDIIEKFRKRGKNSSTIFKKDGHRKESIARGG